TLPALISSGAGGAAARLYRRYGRQHSAAIRAGQILARQAVSRGRIANALPGIAFNGNRVYHTAQRRSLSREPASKARVETPGGRMLPIQSEPCAPCSSPCSRPPPPPLKRPVSAPSPIRPTSAA